MGVNIEDMVRDAQRRKREELQYSYGVPIDRKINIGFIGPGGVTKNSISNIMSTGHHLLAHSIDNIYIFGSSKNWYKSAGFVEQVEHITGINQYNGVVPKVHALGPEDLEDSLPGIDGLFFLADITHWKKEDRSKITKANLPMLEGFAKKNWSGYKGWLHVMTNDVNETAHFIAQNFNLPSKYVISAASEIDIARGNFRAKEMLKEVHGNGPIVLGMYGLENLDLDSFALGRHNKPIPVFDGVHARLASIDGVEYKVDVGHLFAGVDIKEIEEYMRDHPKKMYEAHKENYPKSNTGPTTYTASHSIISTLVDRFNREKGNVGILRMMSDGELYFVSSPVHHDHEIPMLDKERFARASEEDLKEEDRIITQELRGDIDSAFGYRRIDTGKSLEQTCRDFSPRLLQEPSRFRRNEREVIIVDTKNYRPEDLDKVKEDVIHQVSQKILEQGKTYGEAIRNIESRLSGIEGDVGELKDDVGDMKEDLGIVKTFVKDVKEDVGYIKSAAETVLNFGRRIVGAEELEEKLERKIDTTLYLRRSTKDKLVVNGYIFKRSVTPSSIKYHVIPEIFNDDTYEEDSNTIVKFGMMNENPVIITYMGLFDEKPTYRIVKFSTTGKIESDNKIVTDEEVSNFAITDNGIYSIVEKSGENTLSFVNHKENGLKTLLNIEPDLDEIYAHPGGIILSGEKKALNYDNKLKLKSETQVEGEIELVRGYCEQENILFYSNDKDLIALNLEDGHEVRFPGEAISDFIYSKGLQKVSVKGGRIYVENYDKNKFFSGPHEKYDFNDLRPDMIWVPQKNILLASAGGHMKMIYHESETPFKKNIEDIKYYLHDNSLVIKR